MARIEIRPEEEGRIVVKIPYDPSLVAKIKGIPGRRWHPADKQWSVPAYPPTDLIGAVRNGLEIRGYRLQRSISHHIFNWSQFSHWRLTLMRTPVDHGRAANMPVHAPIASLTPRNPFGVRGPLDVM